MCSSMTSMTSHRPTAIWAGAQRYINVLKCGMHYTIQCSRFIRGGGMLELLLYQCGRGGALINRWLFIHGRLLPVQSTHESECRIKVNIADPHGSPIQTADQRCHGRRPIDHTAGCHTETYPCTVLSVL